jgi:kynurenine formamidase
MKIPARLTLTAVAVAAGGIAAGGMSMKTRADERRVVDLSHTIENGMITYKGLPGPEITDHMSREQSRANYSEGTEFQIGRISMVANTGTYLDTPFHRFSGGHDLADLDLATLADLTGILLHVDPARGRAITRQAFGGVDLRGKAVLVHTGWDAHWRTPRYSDGHPFLTEDAATWLKESGALLVGIDSFNIDDTADKSRPVHTILLGAGIHIVEHMRGLEQLPASGFRFSAVPAKVRGMGTFPVRAYAVLRNAD